MTHQKLSFMFENYFKTALRNFRKNKAFSFINIFGLAVGLASCLLTVQRLINTNLERHPFTILKMRCR